MNITLKRRQAIQSLLSGALGWKLSQDFFAPTWNPLDSLFNQTQLSSMDAFHRIKNIGSQRSFLLPFLAQQHALAVDTPASDWGLITVKVLDDLAPLLVFALGAIAEGKVQTETLSIAQHGATARAGAAAEHIAQQGVRSLTTIPRLASLRFNSFFASRLQEGTYTGSSARLTDSLGFSSYVNPFPESVALQCYLSTRRELALSVHQLIGLKLRPSLPDLAYVVENKKIVSSPMGICCFMAGLAYDANGGENANVVYRNSEREIAATGRSVSDYVDILTQSISAGYSDFSERDKNLTFNFDKLVTQDPKLRSSILDFQGAFTASLAELTPIKALESNKHVSELPAEGNLQQIAVNTKGASKFEFLAQCAYVASSLKIPGLPLRNFSLFLNLNDLDGANFDEPLNGLTATSFNSLNYIEGMKQLAMGMNILANAINGKKFIVQIISDGGRTSGNTDSNCGFTIVMGPKSAGGLGDALHADMVGINSNTSTVTTAPGSTVTNWTSSDAVSGLRNAAGAVITNQPTQMTDVQMGVLRFLEEKTGISAAIIGAGNYVHLKRF